MKRTLILALAVCAIAAPASAVTTITTTPAPTPPGDVVVFEDFSARTPGESLGVNASVFAEGESGIAARPAGSVGNFAAVLGGGTASFVFARPASRFGFLLGSLDSYNSLTLNYADGTAQTFNGSAISGGATDGATGGFVTYRRAAADARITGVTFASAQNSSEFDSLSIGGVPEPTTWAMMIFGFGLIGAALRRRSAASVRALRLA